MTDEPLSAYVRRTWIARDPHERADKAFALTAIEELEAQHALAMEAVQQATEVNKDTLAQIRELNAP
jgi:hypothetical protein